MKSRQFKAVFFIALNKAFKLFVLNKNCPRCKAFKRHLVSGDTTYKNTDKERKLIWNF